MPSDTAQQTRLRHGLFISTTPTTSKALSSLSDYQSKCLIACFCKLHCNVDVYVAATHRADAEQIAVLHKVMSILM